MAKKITRLGDPANPYSQKRTPTAAPTAQQQAANRATSQRTARQAANAALAAPKPKPKAQPVLGNAPGIRQRRLDAAIEGTPPKRRTKSGA